MPILLTVAIPTYNRAKLLDNCLSALAKEFAGNESVEILVSNNASTDETATVVSRQREANFPGLRYFENSKNLGPDLNIAQCFREAQGKYVWIFSDDDLLAPTYGLPLLDLLNSNEWGLVHLKSVWYSGDVVPTVQPEELSYQQYADGLEYIEQINYWVTFITGNIVNKSLLRNSAVTYNFNGTYLVQLGWILPAIFAGKPNVLVNTQVLLCRAENSGGYNFYQTFSVNFNKVMDGLVDAGAMPARARDIINHHLLLTYFPIFMSRNMATFGKEKIISVMLPVFWRKPLFWKNIVAKSLAMRLKRKVKSFIKNK